jgi:hypothetical protein
MVDRSQPLVVTPQACPFVALEGDRDQRLPVPDAMHRCFAEATPKARSMGHQASYCLTAAFNGCPIFLDWASRVAADVVEAAPTAAGQAAANSAGAAGAIGSAGSPTASAAGGVATTVAGPTTPETQVDRASRTTVGTSAWVAEAMPPPPDSMEIPSRRTARVVIDPGPGTGADPGAPPPTDAARRGTAAMTGPYPEVAPVPPPPAAKPLMPSATPQAPGDPGMDADSDTAAELAASMARTDLMVDGDAGLGVEPRASTAVDNDGTNSPPWSRGRPRVPMDAGAPASLSPQTRPAARPSGPREWEGARRFEAYAARTGSRRPGRPVLIAIGAVLVAVALLAVFLLPSLFRGGGAGPTAAPSAAGSGGVATARPKATPTAPGATPERPAPTPGSYKVKRGDTLSSIGRKFNVTVVQLTCANKIRNPNSLTPGTTLVIPIETYQCPRPTKKPKRTP